MTGWKDPSDPVGQLLVGTAKDVKELKTRRRPVEMFELKGAASVAPGGDRTVDWSTVTVGDSTLVSSGVITLPVPGVWVVFPTVRFGGFASNLLAWVEHNDGSWQNLGGVGPMASPLGASFSIPVLALAGQTVRVRVNHGAGGSLTMTESRLVVSRLHDLPDEMTPDTDPDPLPTP